MTINAESLKKYMEKRAFLSLAALGTAATIAGTASTVYDVARLGKGMGERVLNAKHSVNNWRIGRNISDNPLATRSLVEKGYRNMPRNSGMTGTLTRSRNLFAGPGKDISQGYVNKFAPKVPSNTGRNADY